MKGKIALEGLEFHAFHGVYPHERESGNYFTVDIAVEADVTKGASLDDLGGTVNYETLFQIVRNEMEKPSKLLESLAEKIIEGVFSQLPTVESIELKIAKQNPPIGGKCKRAVVTVATTRGKARG
jgi:7,8-dihydroneopterin aldolase/epimerase/oxygenase